MGRSSKYSKEQIVTSAAELIAEGGLYARLARLQFRDDVLAA